MKKQIITTQKRILKKQKWFDRSNNSLKPTKKAKKIMNKHLNTDITEEEKDEEENGIL